MLEIKGQPVVNLASSLGSLPVYDTFYFLTQSSNFSDSDNQGPFYIIWIFQPNPSASVYWIFRIKVHLFCLSKLGNSPNFLFHLLSVVWYQPFWASTMYKILRGHLGFHQGPTYVFSPGHCLEISILLGEACLGLPALCVHSALFIGLTCLLHCGGSWVNLSQPHPKGRASQGCGLISASVLWLLCFSTPQSGDSHPFPNSRGCVWLGQKR